MHRRVLLTGAVLLLAATAVAAPYAVYFYPCGIQAGTTRRIVVGGQGLYNVNGGCITGGGVEIVRVTPVPGFPRARGKGQGKWMSDWFKELVDGKVKHHELPPEAVADNSAIALCIAHNGKHAGTEHIKERIMI